MTIANLVDQLWEASVTVESVDIVASRVCLRFNTPQADGPNVVRLIRLEAVQSLEFRKHGSKHWRYAEASEVGLVLDGAILKFGVVLWDEPNLLEVRCLEVWLDDVQIARATGSRFVQ